MAKNTPALRLTWSITQGSADAFKEVSIATGLVSVGAGAKTAIRVIEVGFELTSVVEVDALYGLSLTRTSQTAAPTFDEPSLIVKNRRQIGVTTSGSIYVNDLCWTWRPAEAANVIIVESDIYCQLGTATTSAANTAYGYLLGEYVTVTETERLQLISQSLGG